MAKSEVIFEDNTLKVIDKTENTIEATLLECAAEIVSRTARNTKVDTGQLKNSWKAVVDRTNEGYEAVIGSPLENAIWEEFGTGEYAAKGRKGGYWVFVAGSEGKSSKVSKTYARKEDAKRAVAIMRSKGLDAYYTKGKKARRPFGKAYERLKGTVEKRLASKLKGL